MDFSNVDLALGTLTAYDSGSSVSSGSLAYAVGTAVLSQSLDLTQQMGASMIQMMEHSVNPELGGNIDMYVEGSCNRCSLKRKDAAHDVTVCRVFLCSGSPPAVSGIPVAAIIW